MDDQQLPPPQTGRVLGVLDAVLGTARELLGCELVALNVLTDESVVTARAQGHLPGLSPGTRASRTDTLCHLLLAGTVPTATVVRTAPHLAGNPSVQDLAVRTYVGVPVADDEQHVVGTLCGFDRRELQVDPRSLVVLEQLAAVLSPYAAELAALDATIVRRQGAWLVEGVEPEGTGTALAALLAGGIDVPPVQEREWLVANVATLEAATRDRTAVEQAVGRVAERLGVPPREAFARLQDHARRRHGRVDAETLRGSESAVRSA